MNRTIFSLIAVIALLSGCALDPGTDSIFGTKDDYFVNGMIAGKPFALNQEVHPIPACMAKDSQGTSWACDPPAFDSNKPIMVIPIQRGHSHASTKHNEIRIVQSPNTRGMINALHHELRHYSGWHDGQMEPEIRRDERAALLERERLANCARLGMACY